MKTLIAIVCCLTMCHCSLDLLTASQSTAKQKQEQKKQADEQTEAIKQKLKQANDAYQQRVEDLNEDAE